MSRCMCGATDCDACYGKREPEVERGPECDECGEVAQDRYHPGLRVLITIEEMGGRMLCNGCREARALCDECSALVLNADYDDDGRCPKCAAKAKLLGAAKVYRSVADTYPAGPWREAALGMADKLEHDAAAVTA
jgi:hypothetical protein